MKRSFSMSSRYLLISAGVYVAMAGASFGQIFQGNQRQNQPAGQTRAVGQARTQVAQPQVGQQRYQQGTMQYGQSAGQRVVQGQYEQPYTQWDGGQEYRQSQGGLNNQQEIERRLTSIEREIRQLRQLLQQQGSGQQSYTRSSDRGFDSGAGQYDRYRQQYDDESYQQTSDRYGDDRTRNRDRYEQQSYGGRYSNDQSDYRSGSSGASSGRVDSEYSGDRSRTADRRSGSDSNSSGSRSSASSNDEDEDYQSDSRSGSDYNTQQRSNSGRTGESSSSSRDNSDNSQDD